MDQLGVQTTWPHFRPFSMAKNQASSPRELARALLTQALAQAVLGEK